MEEQTPQEMTDKAWTPKEIVTLIKNGENRLYPTEADCQLIEEYATIRENLKVQECIDLISKRIGRLQMMIDVNNMDSSFCVDVNRNINIVESVIKELKTLLKP